MFAHGGLFKTKGVAQRYLAAAIDTPICVGAEAAEGGAWGIAVLAAYAAGTDGLRLDEYLSRKVFSDRDLEVVEPAPADVAGFDAYLRRFVEHLPVARSAARR
jgi:sugar (pentulose or hexulose) kinase